MIKVMTDPTAQYHLLHCKGINLVAAFMMETEKLENEK